MPMRRGPRWSQNEGGPCAHEADFSVFLKRTRPPRPCDGGLDDSKAGRRPCPCCEGLGGPKAKEAPTPMLRGPR